METKKKKNTIDKDVLIAVSILMGLIVLLGLTLITTSYQLGELRNVQENSHVVPKDYVSVYYSLDDSSIVIVLDSTDPIQKRFAAEIVNYLQKKQ